MKNNIIEESSDNTNESNNIKNKTSLIKEPIKKNDDIKFYFMMKNYFSYSELENMKDIEIIQILRNSHLITFISNIFLETQKKLFWYCCGNFEINFNSCKDVIFLPYEFKFKLIDILSKLIKKNNEFKIVFDNGMIQKGEIYKRIIVQKSYAFIPLEKFQYKLTEYNIRGFCQIVEELGATKIEIDFSHIVEKEKNTKINSNFEIKKIAGDLGFSITNKNTKENCSTYILEYPDNNNLLLNKKKLINNLQNGKYLISFEDYNTNLELQYLINSRCDHFITNYSTNFKIKQNIDFNFDTLINLSLPEISINKSLKYISNVSDNIIIETKVIFNNNYRSPNQLVKYSISPDEIGFNFIFNNIKKKFDEIPTEWLIFLWRFINIYCYENKKLKINQNDNNSDEYNDKIYSFNFSSIIKNLNKIKSNFSLDEIIKILSNYFRINSQMVDFKNFLDILDNKTKAYDELGLFLIIDKNIILHKKETTKNILDFIVSKEKHNEKLKELLQVYNSNCQHQIYKKLKKIGLLNINNWSSLEYLINISKNYKLKENFNESNFEDIYKRLYNNYKFGLSTFEFYDNILPFIENLLFHFWYKQENLEIMDINIILKSISEESFKFNIVTTLDKLKLYLEKKINKYKQIKIIENKIIHKENLEEEFKNYLINNKNTKNFILKKINLVYENNYSNIKLNNSVSKFLKKIICYNERLNIHKISLDKYGFNKIKINLLSGNYENLFYNLWKPFIFKFINFYYPEILESLENKYSNDKKYLYDFLKTNIENYDINMILNKILEDIL